MESELTQLWTVEIVIFLNIFLHMQEHAMKWTVYMLSRWFMCLVIVGFYLRYLLSDFMVNICEKRHASDESENGRIFLWSCHQSFLIQIFHGSSHISLIFRRWKKNINRHFISQSFRIRSTVWKDFRPSVSIMIVYSDRKNIDRLIAVHLFDSLFIYKILFISKSVFCDMHQKI